MDQITSSITSSITCSIIEAIGVIVAAFIGAGYLGNIVKKTAESHFFNYADKKHDLNEILRHAKKSITIVANCGDKLLEKHGSDLSRHMRNGVKVKYLLLDFEGYTHMDTYMSGEKTADYSALLLSLESLKCLKQQDYGNLEIRISRSVFTASFIGVDLERRRTTNNWHPNAVVQIMTYLYRTKAENDPIATLCCEDPRFDDVANSVKALWDSGEVIDIDKYLTSTKSNACKITPRRGYVKVRSRKRKLKR